MRDLDRVRLTFHDSRHPDRITLTVDPTGARLNRDRDVQLSPADAVELASRLLWAVRQSGYQLTAKRQ